MPNDTAPAWVAGDYVTVRVKIIQPFSCGLWLAEMPTGTAAFVSPRDGGSCLTPSEVAALVEAARREEREACAELVAYIHISHLGRMGAQTGIDARKELAAAIRARGTEARHDAR